MSDRIPSVQQMKSISDFCFEPVFTCYETTFYCFIILKILCSEPPSVQVYFMIKVDQHSRWLTIENFKITKQ